MAEAELVCFGNGARVCKPRKIGDHWKPKEARKYTVLTEPPEATDPADTLSLASETNITRDPKLKVTGQIQIAYLFCLASLAF